MTIDRERIERRAAHIRAEAEALERLLATQEEDDILNDPWRIRGIKYSLQTAVEGVIDISYHICAKQFGYAPTDARDSLTKLAESGIIPHKRLATYQEMVGFRNRVVHGYLTISDQLVYAIARKSRADFEAFLSHIFDFIDAE